MTTFAIVPLKRLADAKRRLATDFDPAGRRMLALAMAGDVLAALRATGGIARTLVVTDDPAVSALALAHGATPVRDPRRSLDGAARAGLHAAHAAGATRALLVAGDCPALDPTELAALLAVPVAREPAVVVVSDRHGTGTNGLLLTPPDAIVPAFGPGSCRRHLELAAGAGAAARLERLPSLGLDVDRADDVEALRRLLALRPRVGRRTRLALGSLRRGVAQER